MRRQPLVQFLITLTEHILGLSGQGISPVGRAELVFRLGSFFRRRQPTLSGILRNSVFQHVCSLAMVILICAQNFELIS